MCIRYWASLQKRGEDIFIVCWKDHVIISSPTTLHMLNHKKNHLLLYFYTLLVWTSYWSCNEKNKHRWMRGMLLWGHIHNKNVWYNHQNNKLYISSSYENRNDTSMKLISIFVHDISHTDLTIINWGVCNYYGCLYICTLHCTIKYDSSNSTIM